MSILRWLDANIERMLVAALLAFIVLLISVNVVMRYIFNASLSWAEELTLWTFVWFIWIAVSYGFRSAGHIRITVFRDLLPKRARLFIDLIVDILVLLLLGFVVLECVKLIRLPFVAMQNSVVLGLPIPILYASAPFGAALSSIRVIQNMIRTVRAISGAEVSPTSDEVAQ